MPVRLPCTDVVRGWRACESEREEGWRRHTGGGERTREKERGRERSPPCEDRNGGGCVEVFLNVRKSAKLRAMHQDPKSAGGPYWCHMAELIRAQATGTPDWVLV